MSALDSKLILQAIEVEAKKQGVDPEIAKAIFMSENGSIQNGTLQVRPMVDTNTTSPKGAFGIMQVIPSTFKGLVQKGYLPPTTDMSNWRGQITAGVAGIKERMDAGISDPVELAISYNGSPDVLDGFRKKGHLNPETSEYVQKFTAARNMLGGKPGTVSTTERLSTTISSRNVPDEEKNALSSMHSNFVTLAENIGTQVKGLTDDILGISKRAADATKASGDAAAKVAETTGQVEVAKVENVNSILNAVGINMQGNNEALVKNLRELEQTKNARMEVSKEISKLRSTSLLDDPVGWLFNNLKAMPMVQQHNALAQHENAAAKNIAELQQLASQQIAIQPAAIQQSLQEKALAEAQLARAEAQAKIAGIESTTKQYVSRTLLEQLNASGAAFNQRMAIANLLFEKESTTFATTDSASAKAEKEAQDKLGPINLMIADLGVPTMVSFTPTTFKALNKDMQDKLVKAAQFGRWGETVGEAVTMMRSIIGDPGIQQLVQRDPMRGKFLETAVRGGMEAVSRAEADQRIRSNPMHQFHKLKTPEERLEWGINAWQAEQEEMAKSKNFMHLSDDSPLRLNYKYAADLAQLKGNRFATFVNEQINGGPNSVGIKIDEKVLLGKAVAEIQLDPSKLPLVAKELKDFYTIGLANQHMRTGASVLGFKMPKTYPVRTSLNTFFDRDVDLTNTASLENWLTIEVSKSLKPGNFLGNNVSSGDIMLDAMKRLTPSGAK